MQSAPGGRFQELLGEWAARVQPRRAVLFLDEVDSLDPTVMVNFLAQLRGGFSMRPAAFPSSIGLVGLRDLKDYIALAKGGVPPNPGSPFNIKSESLTLRSFTLGEVRALYAQHTAETAQPFTAEAEERVFYWTQGQPFLVNAIAYHLTSRDPVPPPTPITAEDVERAVDHLKHTRITHLDNLARRLDEPRVARVVRTQDLGLIRRSDEGGWEAASPLYREVLAREAAIAPSTNIPNPWWPWKTASGGLDLPALIDALVTDRDRVVAELTPPRPDRSAFVADALLADAVRKGWLRPASVVDGRPPARIPVTSVKQVLAELAEDRESR